MSEGRKERNREVHKEERDGADGTRPDREREREREREGGREGERADASLMLTYSSSHT